MNPMHGSVSSILTLINVFSGVGYASITMSALVAVYYNVVIAYALYYLFVSVVSFDGEVPWATCGNPWNTHLCRTQVTAITDDMNETLKLNLTLGMKHCKDWSIYIYTIRCLKYTLIQ